MYNNHTKVDDVECFFAIFFPYNFSSSDDFCTSDNLADEIGDRVGGVRVESFLGEKGLHGSNTGGERSEDDEFEIFCCLFLELQFNFNLFSVKLLTTLLLLLTPSSFNTFFGRPGPRFT